MRHVPHWCPSFNFFFHTGAFPYFFCLISKTASTDLGFIKFRQISGTKQAFPGAHGDCKRTEFELLVSNDVSKLTTPTTGFLFHSVLYSPRAHLSSKEQSACKHCSCEKEREHFHHKTIREQHSEFMCWKQSRDTSVSERVLALLFQILSSNPNPKFERWILIQIQIQIEAKNPNPNPK